MNSDSVERLRDIEARLAHFERLCDDLSDIVAGQSKEIVRLKQQLGALSSRVLDLQQDWRPGGADEKPPPHY
ncbi:SlyX family protein [Hwanghaeella sp.]|uniref:SlyX family protein n=1 Tax=Hwanghaeella sp. TaxID=2605943 RepID=UPI003CCBEDE8